MCVSVVGTGDGVGCTCGVCVYGMHVCMWSGVCGVYVVGCVCVECGVWCSVL